MSIVSNNIKYLRRINQLTQEQFARRIGIKRSLVGAYEEARANPNLDNLKLMANLFGISVDALIKSDVRRLKSTPDITFDFEPDEKISEPTQPTVYSNQRPKVEPKSISELMQGMPDPDVRNRSIEENFYSPKPKIEPVQPPQQVFTQAVETFVKPGIDNNRNYRIVRKHQVIDYMNNRESQEYINKLEICSIPFFNDRDLRVFEAPEEYTHKSAFFVAKKTFNEKEISDGKQYLIFSRLNGLILRRVYNQVQIKGSLLTVIDFKDLPSHEITYSDVIEMWEVMGVFSNELPPPPPNFAKVNSLIDQLKSEVDRIKP